MMALIGLGLQAIGGIELIVLFGFLVLILLLLFVVGKWIYQDAILHGSDHPVEWAIGIIVLILFGLVPGLLGVVIYLLVRGEKVEKSLD